MYQFIISEGVLPPFTLHLGHPHIALPLEILKKQSVTTYKNCLVLVTTEDHKHPQYLDMLEVSSIIPVNMKKIHMMVLLCSRMHATLTLCLPFN